MATSRRSTPPAATAQPDSSPNNAHANAIEQVYSGARMAETQLLSLYGALAAVSAALTTHGEYRGPAARETIFQWSNLIEALAHEAETIANLLDAASSAVDRVGHPELAAACAALEQRAEQRRKRSATGSVPGVG
jgi:hypothetical protein